MINEIKFEMVHISMVSIGDTIEHNGKEITIGRENLDRTEFMGWTINGDSYVLGRKLVKRIIY